MVANINFLTGYSSPALTGICTIATNVTQATSHANIGAPLRNTSAMIVASQETFKLLPRGATGELCFGGTQVVRQLSSHSRASVRANLRGRPAAIPV